VISSEFKRSGVYPCDPNALDYGTSKGTHQIRSLKQSLLKLESQLMVKCLLQMQILHQLLLLKKKRISKTIFDIVNPQYLLWFKDQHPDKF